MKNQTNHPITLLTIDLAKLLHDRAGIQQIQILCAKKMESDLSCIAWKFVDWLLMDPTNGLINISCNAGVKASIAQTSNDVAKPQAAGSAVLPSVLESVKLAAELTKARAWNVYKFASLMQTDQRIKRAEWAIAAATFNAAHAASYGALTGAVHAAAIAWDASRAVAFYESALAKLIALLRDEIKVGDSVSLSTAVCGRRTGIVKGILADGNTPPTAIVNVDHVLPGIYWHGPIEQIKKAVEA